MIRKGRPSSPRTHYGRGRTAAARYSLNFTDERRIRLYNESFRHLGGDGVPEDYERSFKLNRQAALAGDWDAILAMGWYYLGGIGVERDLEAARRWYRKSARHGEPMAMFSLGYIACVERQYEEAFDWFTKAIAKGHVRSLYWLGKLHWRGRGTPTDQKLAMHLFQQAAAKNVREARRFLRFVSSCRKPTRMRPRR